MANEAEKFSVDQTGVQTPVSLPFEVKQAGIDAVHENKDHGDLHNQIQEAGGAVTGDQTPLSAVTGDLNHEQFELPKIAELKKLPVKDTRRWHGFVSILKKRKELKHAA